MNKLYERVRKDITATLACVQQCHVDASIKTFHKCQTETCGNATLATQGAGMAFRTRSRN